MVTQFITNMIVSENNDTKSEAHLCLNDYNKLEILSMRMLGQLATVRTYMCFYRLSFHYIGDQISMSHTSNYKSAII
jgi:hypothetical protein